MACGTCVAERRCAHGNARRHGNAREAQAAIMNVHKEIAFENDICAHLAANGWLYA
jgi:hypothetical protein